MKYIIRILLFIVIALVCIGYYFKNSGNHVKGDQLVGIGILVASFILMPLFIYFRWKDKKVKDYMLTEENLRKMRDFKGSDASKKNQKS